MSGLLGPTEIRELAEGLGLTPTKKLGQNFVHDPNTVRRIVRLAGVGPGEEVLEVGPGLGSLTLGLLEAGARVTAIEIDGRLADRLPVTVARLAPGARIDVLAADALRVTALPRPPRRLVANLPYNVSVPVLLHLLAHFPSLKSALVMVQAEVGERIAASPGGRVYGSPSAKAAWYGEWSLAGRVSRQVFWPEPNVDSVLVGYRRQPVRGTDAEREATFALIEAAFGQRRKMLRQALAEVLGGAAVASAALQRAGIAPSDRAERLGVEQYLALARALPGAASTG